MISVKHEIQIENWEKAHKNNEGKEEKKLERKEWKKKVVETIFIEMSIKRILTTRMSKRAL